MKLFLIGAALAFLALTPREAAACTCVRTPKIDPREFLKQFDGAVFEGTLLRQETVAKGFEDPHLKLTYRVERHWKGVTSPQVVVYTPSDTGQCGIGAEPKVTRFIIAYRTPRGLETGICIYAFDRQALRTAVGDGSPSPKQ
jgi:hypothetical protein